MVGHAVVREDATKDVTIVTVVPNTIFTSFDILRDLPRNGYLTRAENHRHPLPLESIYRREPNGGKISLLFVCLMVDLILLVDRYPYSLLFCFFS